MANVAESSGKLFLPKTADAIFEIGDMVAFIAKANTSANVAITTTQNQIKGGKNNSVIGIITTERAVEVSFSTPEWQPEFLAANIGTKIKYGEQAFIIDDVVYTAGENGVVTLTETPVDGKVQVEVNGKWTTINLATGEDDELNLAIDLSGLGFKNGDCVNILGAFLRDGLEISITTDTDPSVGKLTLSSDIFKGTLGKVGEAQYVFPSFALSGNWTQAFSSDASYEISGTPIAVAGEKCGEGETYGYYRQFIENDETLNAFVAITASPSVVELTVGENETLTVYGERGALSENSVIAADKLTFAVEGGEATVISVDTAGKITASGAGNAKVLVTYEDLTATVEVSVTAATTGG